MPLNFAMFTEMFKKFRTALYDRLLLRSSVVKQKLKATDAFAATSPIHTTTVMKSGTWKCKQTLKTKQQKVMAI